MFRTLIIFALIFSSLASASETKTTYHEGWLDTSGVYPVVHLNGSESEMGKQLGYLVGDQIAANIKNLKEISSKNQGGVFSKMPDFVFVMIRRIVGFTFWKTFSPDVKTHIKGIVKGAAERSDKVKLNKFDIAFLNSVIDLTGIIDSLNERFGGGSLESHLMQFLGLPEIRSNCDSFAAWGPRTVGGKTFMTRNTDIQTGVGMEKYPLIMVIKKDGKVPVVTATLAGLVGMISGMNANGVGLGQVWATSSDIKLHTPWQLQMREIFMDAISAQHAVLMFSQMGKVVYGSNFVFADPREGYAVEATAHHFSIFKPNDQRELEAKWNGQTYGLPMPNAVFRGDVSMDMAIRAVQTSANGPKGDPREAGSYNDRYRDQYLRIKEYEDKGELIGVEQAIAISKGTAMKHSNLMNAVYSNNDLDMWVTYSKINDDGSTTQAFEREYVNIPFYKYLLE